MGTELYRLSESEWSKIGSLMPRGGRGAHRVDDRRVIGGIVHMRRIATRPDERTDFFPAGIMLAAANTRWTGCVRTPVSDRWQSTTHQPRRKGLVLTDELAAANIMS